MKRILITGKNSYVGTKFMEWVSQWPEEYQVDAISVRGDEWKQHDFSGYDSVLHVAGIAHIKETKENRELYYKVNRDLGFEVAKKSKEAGIPHFVYLSSMSVYGLETGVIDKDTVPKPKNSYGKSKYEAEQLIKDLETEQFKIAIVRPPMVYGPNSPGNYAKLSKLLMVIPVFPIIKNKRSIIFVDNMSEFLKIIVDSSISGIYLPQNGEVVSTLEIVKNICIVKNKRIYFINLKYPHRLLRKIGLYRKVFCDLYYCKSTDEAYLNYQVISFEKSIIQSEIN